VKLDVAMPAGWHVGSKHFEPVRGYMRPVHFVVEGWYINHCREPGIQRFIKDGNAYAVRFIEKPEELVPVASVLPKAKGDKSAKRHRRTMERGGPRAFKQMRSEVYDWR